MTTINLNQITATVLLLLISFGVHSEETVISSEQKKGFVDAKIIERKNPKYPRIELERGNAGMVDVLFMVDKEGNAFEPIVEVSSKPAFEKFALESLKNDRFEPATLNGKPINSVHRSRIIFLVKDQNNQVSQAFAKNYKSALKELNKDESNKDKIKKKIRSMEKADHLGPYSYRHMNTVKYFYAKKYDSKQSQIDAIYQLLLFEGLTKKDEAALEKDQRISVRRLLVSLLIQTSQYGSALREFETLKKIDPEANKLLKKPIDQIHEVLKGDQLVKTPLYINEQGYNSVHLFKNTFGFTDGSNIDELKLRCEKKFKILEYKPDSEYKIPKSWGHCFLQTIGTPGSNVELYQL